jgi:hypothetical protein
LIVSLVFRGLIKDIERLLSAFVAGHEGRRQDTYLELHSLFQRNGACVVMHLDLFQV